MAVKYDLRLTPHPKGEGGKQTLHPRIVVSGTKDMEDIVKEISEHSSFAPGDICGILKEFSQFLVRHLADGYNVKVDDLGTFTATLSSRPVQDKSEIRSVSVTFDDINFRPAPDLLKAVRKAARIERAEPGRGFRTSSDKYSKEERFQLLSDYLKEHPFITRAEYTGLTGLLRSKATIELNEWAQGGRIKKNGKRPHIVYTISYKNIIPD